MNDLDELDRLIKAEALRRGYMFIETAHEVRMVRPDGTLALRVTRKSVEDIAEHRDS